ncbi:MULTISPECIES: GlsB/YeaQ/YmgE family stress response membrane protein [Variovorax]|uniref:GlsB/YeaQ/YmgE family stress response membrane protein n=1 Tax=Variovorax TaxID=34072 RepID=UPI000370EF20|nr:MULTISPECIES: GlsB/YeaQ/YmgE family stress response membrane protein [Variovorax]MBB3643133.1 putative membrane protein YeaQ/YmgE (transglycosylase-associated protein family) [Variovorax sp. BK613]MDR6523892.1 putative membrane protein YeaQ/YmgE (transglycosylase-associated protein family) [Variovorax paradoxus]RTD84775.1 GlsB/YeaQ/YmgE family stress response membrane protein [Variovorax sp. 369]
MHIIWTILIGFIAGLLARAVLPGNNSMGFILTAVLGIAGSLVATYAGQAMGWYSAGAGAGFIASVVGAAVLLGVWHLVSR